MSFATAARRALLEGDHSSISDLDLQTVLTMAVKLYAARIEFSRDPLPPLLENEVTPTEVVTIASEMIRVVDLNPFDLSMWYRRAR